MSRASRGWTGSSRIRTGSSRSSRISHNATAEMVWHASNRHKAMAVRRERPARAAGSRAESRRPMEIKSEDAADDTMTAAQCRCGGNSRANVANGGWREGVLGVWPVLPSRLQQHGLRPLQESVKAPGGPPFPPPLAPGGPSPSPQRGRGGCPPRRVSSYGCPPTSPRRLSSRDASPRRPASTVPRRHVATTAPRGAYLAAHVLVASWDPYPGSQEATRSWDPDKFIYSTRCYPHARAGTARYKPCTGPHAEACLARGTRGGREGRDRLLPCLCRGPRRAVGWEGGPCRHRHADRGMRRQGRVG